VVERKGLRSFGALSGRGVFPAGRHSNWHEHAAKKKTCQGERGLRGFLLLKNKKKGGQVRPRTRR